MPRKKDPLEAAREVLAQNRGWALGFLQQAGERRTRDLLTEASVDLEKRLRAAAGPKGPGDQSFTYAQLKANLEQVRQVTRGLNAGLKDQLLEQGAVAAEHGAEGTATYLAAADEAFRGVGTQPLALRPALMLGAAREGAESSLLARIAGDPMHPGQAGVLARYGASTVRVFERRMQLGILAKKSKRQMADDLIGESPFLKGHPRYWADRIVRTEQMGALNRGQWEATKQVHKQLGGMTKVLSSVIDDRTGADSMAVHGQIRRPEEAFESWFGMFQHPPDRPNDRAIVTPHRETWPIPPYLMPLDDDRIFAAWRAEGRKGPPPPRPLMSTLGD